MTYVRMKVENVTADKSNVRMKIENVIVDKSYVRTHLLVLESGPIYFHCSTTTDAPVAFC